MKRASLLAVAGFALLLHPAGAAGQGSGVMTHSACATAMGAAGVASPCPDGSAILFNPAAIVLQGSTLGLGWSGITTSSSFTYDESLLHVEREAVTSSVPFAYLTHRLNRRLGIGIGVFAPYGLGIEWPVEEFEGRYVGYDNTLTNIYIQPTVAYRLTPAFSIGAGLDFVRADIDIRQRVDLATTPTGSRHPVTEAPLTFGHLGVPLGTDFADVRLAGDGSALTFHLGALARLSDAVSVGMRYLHRARVDYAGDATFEQVPTGLTLAADNPLGLPAGTSFDAVVAPQFQSGGALVDQPLTTALTLPAQLVVGVAVQATPALRVLGDYQWTGWERFDQATLDFESSPDQVLVLDYQNAHTYRLGAEFGATDALALRAGYIYNTAAQREFSVSPLLPEAERNYFSIGVGYRFTDSIALDLGYQNVQQADRRGRVRGRVPGQTRAELEALDVGVYSSDAYVLNATLSYRFGGR